MEIIFAAIAIAGGIILGGSWIYEAYKVAFKEEL